MPPATNPQSSQALVTEDLESLAGTIEDGKQITMSLLSNPYTTVNVREPVINHEASGFVYNYYTRDERLPIEDQKFETVDTYISVEEFNESFQGTKILPRYNRLIFNHTPSNPEIQQGSSLLIDNFLGSTSNGDPINLRIDRIITEGTFANLFYTSANLIDTNLDRSVYDFLNTSLLFNEIISGEDSISYTADQIEKRVNSYINRNEEDNPQVIRQFIQQIERTGQGLIEESPNKQFVDDFMIKIRNQSFLLGFNSLFIDDIISASTDESLSIFEDEIRSMKNFTTSVQNKAISVKQAGNINLSDFQNIYGLGYLHDYSTSENNLLENFVNPTINIELPHVKHIGYVLSKKEVTKDNTVINHKPEFFGNTNLTEIIDTQVVYGHTFSYKIKSVSAVEYDFISTLPTNSQEMGHKIRGLFFVSSRSSTINFTAIEKKPPEPPTFLRFNYQRNKGLMIEWDHPVNNQRDIIAFLIYRRRKIDEPFELIRELNFDKSAIKTQREEKPLASRMSSYNSFIPYYIDREFNNDSKFIYSVVSADAHGYTSSYSPQYGVSYNRPTNKIEITTVSKRIAPKAYPNMYLNSKGTNSSSSDFMKDNMKVTNKKRMTVFFNPDYYHAFKKIKDANNSSMSMSEDEIITTEDLNLLQASSKDGEPIYRIHLINTDLLKDQIVDICINDISTLNVDIPEAPFEENNFSFELLHPNKYE